MVEVVSEQITLVITSQRAKDFSARDARAALQADYQCVGLTQRRMPHHVLREGGDYPLCCGDFGLFCLQCPSLLRA